MSRKPTYKQLYKLKNALLEERLERVTPYEFFRDMFPEGYLEERGNFDDRKPNAIYTVIKVKVQPDSNEDKRFAKNTIMFNDLKELDEVLGAEFAVTSPITYFGRNRKASNAYHLWGFTIDLDGVEEQQLKDLFFQIQNGVLPEPTYLVNSGTGIHVYYLFEEPIPLYPRLYKPLSNLKHGLTDVVWNKYTSTIEPKKKQFQGILQGFRMPGTQSKLGKNYPVVAYRMGPKHTLKYLNDFVAEKYRLPSVDYDEMNHLTIDAAKVLYPDWYQARIVEGQPKGRWTCKRDLYDWWIRQIKEGAFDGNRYNCIATLMTMAIKCDIDEEEVLNDALELLPWLNSLTENAENEFTEKDIYDATRFYNASFVTYSLKAIEARTKIQIPRNKRNGRKREDHLKRARAVQNVDYPDGEWRYKGGAPTKREIVATYRADHPSARKADCIRETGLNKKTVYKWWDAELEPDLSSVLKVNFSPAIVKQDGTRIPIPFASEKQK